MNAADTYLARLRADRPGGQLGQIVASGGRDEQIPLPSWWLEDRIQGNPGSVLTVLNAAGRDQLARVSDWTAHRRTWGAMLVRQWLAGWHQDTRMAAYYAAFPASSWGWSCGTHYDPQALPSPPVHTPQDQAAQALVQAGGDHAAAQLVASCLGCAQVRLHLQLAPLAYGEGLEVWCQLTREGRLGGDRRV